MYALHGTEVKTDVLAISLAFQMALGHHSVFITCLPPGSGSRWNPDFLLIGLETKINFRTAGLKEIACTGLSTIGS